MFYFDDCIYCLDCTFCTVVFNFSYTSIFSWTFDMYSSSFKRSDIFPVFFLYLQTMVFQKSYWLYDASQRREILKGQRGVNIDCKDTIG